MAEHIVDALGLKCPLPLLKAHKALKSLAAGEVLRVLTSDPISVSDFQSFCAESGDAFLRAERDGATYSVWIRRAG